MRRAVTVGATLALAATLAAAPAFAGGFRIPEAGARAMGFAVAFVGLADDPSAVQYNPAGLPSIEGTRILLGGTSISTENSYRDGAGNSSDAEDLSFFPPFFYYTNHIQDGPWYFGLGLTSPFGLGTEWDVGTFNSIATETNLEMLKVNPAVGFRANDRWSVGFGVDYYQVMTAEFQNDISSTVVTALTLGAITGQVGHQKLSGDGTAYGFNVGEKSRPTENLAVGFAYRTGADVDVEGDVSLTVRATGTEFSSFDATTVLSLPATAALGINYKFGKDGQLNFDLDWTGWSAYDKLEIKDDAGTVRNPLTSKKDYEDTIAYRLGVEVPINESWAVRGGILFEPMPVPQETYEPRLPDGDRSGFVVGGGYKSGKWTADLACMFLTLAEEDVDSDVLAPINYPPTNFQQADGTYEGSITLIGFDVGYAF